MDVTLYRPHTRKAKRALEELRSCGDQDTLNTFTEPCSPPEDITNVGVRLRLKLYGAVRSTSLNKLRYILYTKSVSRSSLSSGYKLESLPTTSAAAKSHYYRAYIAVQQFLVVPRQRRGDGATLTTHNQQCRIKVARGPWHILLGPSVPSRGHSNKLSFIIKICYLPDQDPTSP